MVFNSPEEKEGVGELEENVDWVCFSKLIQPKHNRSQTLSFVFTKAFSHKSFSHCSLAPFFSCVETHTQNELIKRGQQIIAYRRLLVKCYDIKMVNLLFRHSLFVEMSLGR